MKTINLSDKTINFTKDTQIIIPNTPFSDYIKRELTDKVVDRKPNADITVSKIVFSLGITDEVRSRFAENEVAKEREEKSFSNDFVENTVLETLEPIKNVSDEEYYVSFGAVTYVSAVTAHGFLRALSTVMSMTDHGGITESEIIDAPCLSIRGYRVYMPGKDTFKDFVDMLDFLVYYKFNRIILEVGGAMEYERHPIINEKWIEFCKDMSEYSGKADDVQESQHWAKNSIHYENGDGSYLTKAECRILKHECDIRGIEIIPECPTLSHADYICLAYPELAERDNDPYPDTYCPSNPESYKVVFDILDEVIEVFEPKSINIGHDEFYTVGICPRCQGKDLARIYADDVKTIKDYLASRGVETYMWGEKLLKARFPHGGKIGGWYEEKNYNGVSFRIPWLFRCADMLPEGVNYLHWYWEFGEHLDDEFHAREYPVVFGNFSALRCDNYRTRINRGVKGAFVSNWGSNAVEYMQRNGQFYGLVSTGYALWSDTYDDKDRDALREFTVNELYIKHNSLIKNPIRVRHAAHYSVPGVAFWCGRFIVDEVYMLGDYEVTYKDGTKHYLPVKLGTNIANISASKREVIEAVYSTMPIKTGSGYIFEHVYENPNPESEIISVKYIPREGKTDIKVDYEFPDLDKNAIN